MACIFTLTKLYSSVFHLAQGHCVLQTISISSSRNGENLPENFIGFDSAPDKVDDGSVVHVRYFCSRPCQLTVEVVASTLKRTDLVVLRRKWISSMVRVYRIHQVQLRWPPSILYQHSFFNRRVLDIQNVTIRAWLDHHKDGSELGTYHGSMMRIAKVLHITPLSERSAKPTTMCPSWSAHLMWQMSRNRLLHCPHESGQIRCFISSAAHLYDQNLILLVTFCWFSSHRHNRLAQLPPGEYRWALWSGPHVPTFCQQSPGESSTSCCDTTQVGRLFLSMVARV